MGSKQRQTKGLSEILSNRQFVDSLNSHDEKHCAAQRVPGLLGSKIEWSSVDIFFFSIERLIDFSPHLASVLIKCTEAAGKM